MILGGFILLKNLNFQLGKTLALMFCYCKIVTWCRKFLIQELSAPEILCYNYFNLKYAAERKNLPASVNSDMHVHWTKQLAL